MKMKYLVMECHNGYAVLMDEGSCFVHAANLNYTVGQTVTDPVLMEETPVRSSITRSMIVRVTAAAACALLVSTAGFGFYNRNMKTQSVVTINSDLKIEMELNSKGKVLKLHSDTDAGQEIISFYSGKTKDSAMAANELLKLQIEHGYISDGDTVDLLIDAEDADAYSSYKKELEEELSELKVNVKVHETEIVQPPKPPVAVDPPKVSDPPKKDKDKNQDKVEPPAPPKDKEKPDAPKPPEPPKPADGSAPNKAEPPTPPEPPKDEPAVKPGETPAEPPVAPPAEPPADVDPPEPPAPPADKIEPSLHQKPKNILSDSPAEPKPADAELPEPDELPPPEPESTQQLP